VSEAGTRLAQLRGGMPPRAHNARTIAALTSNPGCARRAVLDAAGIDKHRLAGYAGFPAPFGQSQFAITRGNAFEALVKADGCAELLRLLREQLGLPVPEVSYDDLEQAGGSADLGARHARTRALLERAAGSGPGAGTLFDHPLLRLTVGGQPAYLEPDLIAFRLHGEFRVVEIKSFAIIDGQADPEKTRAAAVQSAVYVLALRELLDGIRPGLAGVVSDRVILVCPENFSNRPALAELDVRKQLTVLRRQLSRLERIGDLTGQLPGDLSYDLEFDHSGVPRRPAAEVIAALRAVPARYLPECLATCELCRFCRQECRGTTAALGRAVRDDLGGVDYVTTALRLAAAEAEPAAEDAETAGLLAAAMRLRAECLGESP
jgi:hypothetical protein